VQHQPQISLNPNCDAFANTAQLTHYPSFHARQRRLRGAQQERARNPNLFEGLAHDAGLKRPKIRGNVG
jgi:hypothetical protein